MKVLLIEDDVDVADTIKAVLDNYFKNVQIEHVKDGFGFHKGTWRVAGWNLVILDLMMPGITGFEACEQLRQFRATAKVPILALTGYDTLLNEERIKASGATGYMAKPFEVAKLREEIQRLTVARAA